MLNLNVIHLSILIHIHIHLSIHILIHFHLSLLILIHFPLHLDSYSYSFTRRHPLSVSHTLHIALKFYL